MPHHIVPDRTSNQNIRKPGFDIDIEVTCFPNNRVRYKANFVRVDPGVTVKVGVQAVFTRRGKIKNSAKKATFSSAHNGVEGVPPGNNPRTGLASVGTFQVDGVDDFNVAWGVFTS